MDKSEEIVEKLLKQMGFKSVIYEPDGNIPPDFLADHRVAVEVRRLNQNYESANGMQGLEETAIPLWQKLEKLCNSFGRSEGESWFLCFRFSRPLKPWKSLESDLRKALADFMAQPTRINGNIYRKDCFKIDVIRASEPAEYYFSMGASSDDQAGGLIVTEMLKNVAYCAEEKRYKSTKFRSKYPEWWLILTDHIALGLDNQNQQQFLAHAKRPDGWDKIVIVSPQDHNHWFSF